MSKNLQLDREYGLHSNIPPCCVEYYVYLIANGVKTPGWYVRGKFPALEEYRAKHDYSPQYVTCPQCSQAIIDGRLEPDPLHVCRPDLSADCANFRTRLYARVTS